LDLAAEIYHLREPQKIPQVMSPDETRRVLAFARTWHRPPSDDELHAAVEDHVREEILYRVGLSIGLDKNDTVVRRRLRQKMEFLFEDTVPELQESDLRDFYDAHGATFP
jgi:hypothetical protein